MYRLLRDPPRCTKLDLKLRPLVGCPLMASFSLANSKLEPSDFHVFYYLKILIFQFFKIIRCFPDSQTAETSFHWYVGEPDTSLISPVMNNAPGGKLIGLNRRAFFRSRVQKKIC